MFGHVLAILIGAAIAALVTPWILWAWQRLAPVRDTADQQYIAAESWHRGERIGREAIIFTIFLLFLLAAYVGFGRRADNVFTITVIAALFGMPTVWVYVRTRFLGPGAMQEFVRYFEAKHQVSFRSWLWVSVPAIVVSIAGLFLMRG